jgi:hypothetical protein
MFDVLVYLDNQGLVDMDYHFARDMNTYVIDRLNGFDFWWYQVKYSGGWAENNHFRMDHYPWKDGTSLWVFPFDELTLTLYYSKFREEVSTRDENGGSIIIPEVRILGETVFKEYQNLEVTAHNLRSDVFQIGTITAIDAILTLGDLGEITYELKWYESIGSATIVKSYWVEAIDKDMAHGRCGWVYESGYKDVRGNHIHLPSDTRVLNSPEYILYFWICI